MAIMKNFSMVQTIIAPIIAQRWPRKMNTPSTAITATSI